MSLQVWLPLNGDLTNQGLSNVTVTNNDATVDNSGIIGKCYSFGPSKRITVSQPANLSTTQVSLSCWINLSAWGSSYDSIVNLSNGTSWNSTKVALIRDNTTNRICFCISNGSTYNKVTMTSDLPLNTWTYLTGTFDGSTIKIYINGVLNNSIATTFNAIVYSSAVLNIGSWSNNNNYPINGKLNDIRLYNHCLSAKEVKELSKGLVLHYRLAGPGGENLFTNTSPLETKSNNEWIQLGNDTTAIFDTNGLIKYTVSFDAKSEIAGSFNLYSTSGSNPKYTWPNTSINLTTDWQHFSYTFTPTMSNSTGTWSRISIYGTYGTGKIPSIKNVKLERGSVQTPWCPNPADALYSAMGYNNNIEYDCSGYRRNGTKNGNITWDIDSPRYITSYKFNGASAIKNNNFIFTTNKWTISLWYKYLSAPTAYEGLCCLSKGDGSDANKKIAIMPNKNYIWFKAENTSYKLSSLKINEWCHLVVTCDGTTAIIYENGIQKGTTSPSAFYTDTSDLVVGARASSSGAATTSVYSKAKISDFRIYATALNEKDILELYQTSFQIDNNGNSYAYELIEQE